VRRRRRRRQTDESRAAVRACKPRLLHPCSNFLVIYYSRVVIYFSRVVIFMRRAAAREVGRGVPSVRADRGYYTRVVIYYSRIEIYCSRGEIYYNRVVIYYIRVVIYYSRVGNYLSCVVTFMRRRRRQRRRGPLPSALLSGFRVYDLGFRDQGFGYRGAAFSLTRLSVRANRAPLPSEKATFRESSRCSRDTYPASYITKYILF